MKVKYSFSSAQGPLFGVTYEFLSEGDKEILLKAAAEALGAPVTALRSFVSSAVPFNADHACTWLEAQGVAPERVSAFRIVCPKPPLPPAPHRVQPILATESNTASQAVAPLPRTAPPSATNRPTIRTDAHVIRWRNAMVLDAPITFPSFQKAVSVVEAIRQVTSDPISLEAATTAHRAPILYSRSLVIGWVKGHTKADAVKLDVLLGGSPPPQATSTPPVPRSALPVMSAAPALTSKGAPSPAVHAMPPRKARSDIERAAKAREITQLTHFTRYENLAGILQRGIVARAHLDAGSTYNDPLRLDRREHAVCTSVSFPNYKMFYSYRMENQDNKWGVLVLDPAVLWELDCGFVDVNAASAGIPALSEASLKTLDAFNRMFADRSTPGIPSLRGHLNLPLKYPTNPQAEVLVFQTIPTRYILRIDVNFQPPAQSLRSADGRAIPVQFDQTLFWPRQDYAYWQVQ